MIHLLVSCIVDSKIDIIIANPKFSFASNNIDLKTLEYFLFEVILTLYQNLVSFLDLILKTSASTMEDHCFFWNKPSADLENNIEYDKQALHNHVNNPNAVIVDGNVIMLLGDNIFQSADRFFIDQSVTTKNK